MGNLAVPTGKPITVDNNFSMYLAVATENSTSKNYDAEDLAKIKKPQRSSLNTNQEDRRIDAKRPTLQGWRY